VTSVPDLVLVELRTRPIKKAQHRCYDDCIDAIPRVNVALNRPAWQSSVRCDGRGCHGAHKVTDGSMVTNHFVAPGCAHGRGPELNPWLAIDLGVPIYVDGVDVTSRGPRSGEYYLHRQLLGTAGHRCKKR